MSIDNKRCIVKRENADKRFNIPDTKDGIGSVLRLAVCSVQSDQFLIDLSLLGGVKTNNSGSKDLIDVLDCLYTNMNENSFALLSDAL